CRPLDRIVAVVKAERVELHRVREVLDLAGEISEVDEFSVRRDAVVRAYAVGEEHRHAVPLDAEDQLDEQNRERARNERDGDPHAQSSPPGRPQLRGIMSPRWVLDGLHRIDETATRLSIARLCRKQTVAVGSLFLLAAAL